MPDLNEAQAALPTKIVGSDASGQENNFVQATPAGGLHTNLRDASGTEAGTTSNPLAVRPGVDLTIISTALPLAANASFTSSVIDLNTVQGTELTFGVFSDQASSATGLQIQWSHDGTNFDHIENYGSLPAMSAGNGKTFTQRKVARYLRVVFGNGPTLQTAFRLTVYLNASASKHSSHRIGTDLDDNSDATLVKASMTGRKATGVHSPAQLTNNNDLEVADILDNGGLNGAISVGTTAVAIRVGGSNLTNRKRLTFWNNGTATLYWGLSNAVTTANGFPIMRNQPVSDDWGPNTTLWIIAGSGTHDVRVVEEA